MHRTAMLMIFCLTWVPTVSANNDEEVTATNEEVKLTDSKKPTNAAIEIESNGKLTRLSKTDEVWVDMQNKRVIVGGRICLDKGVLEMFACPAQTKEHESVVSVNAKAKIVHTALLAVGAKPGKPVTWDPKYVPATGQKIRVEVVWEDENGKIKKRRAQDMIRHVRTRKPMEHDWVFAGSDFWTDEESGEKYYLAEGGELICVSNFSSAMMDLPIQSTQAEADLLFEALNENIPPMETKVKLILTPEDEEKKAR